jgi:hypothetical protein
MRFTGIHALLDSFETSGEHHRGAEIRIARRVRGTKLDTPAAERNPKSVGTVVSAIALKNRSPGESAHRSFEDQALIRVYSRRDDRDDRGEMCEDAGKELVSELGEAASAWVVGVFEKVGAGVDVGEGAVEVGA